MASLSNINGIFDVHSTGAVQFNGNHGASGQILRSNGNASPTWIDFNSTGFGGDYVPIAGNVTITGAIATASGISFTVGGVFTLQGSGTNTTTFDTTAPQLIIKNSAYTTASGLALRSSNNTWQMQLYASGGGTDYGFLGSEWGAWNMRKNNSGGLYLNNNTTYFVQPESTSNMNAATFAGNVTAATFNTLPIETARNNNADRIVRTNVHGYVDFGWINTTSGATTSTIDRIYASNDGYIRYVTPATFRTQVTDPYYAPAGTVSGVTSVATGSGLTGGTITTTGTLSLDRPNSALGAVLATYGTTGSGARIRCTAPFNTNSGKMFSIEITLYTSYTQHNYVVSAYMYSTTNQWYSPKAIYTTTGSATPDIYVGRDANGKAYISILNAAYAGVLVHNMTQGYVTSLADTYDPWTITLDNGNENSVSVATSQIWTTANHTPGNYLPLSGGTMTGAINMGGQNISNATDIYNNAWFRNQNSNEGLYNTATGNHWSSQGGYWDVGYSGTNGIRLRNGHNGTILGYLYAETTGQFGLLDKDGNWTFRTDGATVTELRCNDVTGFQMNASGNVTLSVTPNLGNTAPSRVLMSDSTTVKYCDLATARSQFNLSYSSFRRMNSTNDTNYWTGTWGWGATNMNSTLAGYGSGFFDVWSNPPGQPSGTSHWNGYQALHYKNTSNLYGYQLALGAGDPNNMYVRGIWGGSSWGSWYRMHNDKSALIKINNQISISTYNDRNLKIQGASSSDAGITGYAGTGGHVWQLYGSGNDYGFLNGNWAAWDLRKTKNGNLYMNNSTTYYLNTSSTSYMNAVTLIGTFSGQNGYFNQDVAIGFNSGNIGGKLNIQINSANGIGIKNNLNGVSNPTGLLSYTSASMNAGGYHMVFQAAPTSGSDTNMLLCNLNGNLRNRNNSYGQYSDETIKENITDATPKLEDVKKLKVKNFNFIGDDLKQIGLIAQETEKVFPGLVEDDLNPQGDRIKSLKYSVLVPILVKAIQELEVRVKELENK